MAGPGTSASGPGIRDASAVKMRLEEEICSLISEVQDFNPSTIDRIELPSPLEFHRYVASNRPVIITLPPSATTIHDDDDPARMAPSAQDKEWSWPAYTKWTNDYLTRTLGEKEITVACTPNGWADAVVDDTYFAMPCEKKMTFSQFLDGMPIRTQQKKAQVYENDAGNETKDETPRRDPYQEVRYIQLQNGNLMTEYEELMEDVPVEIPFASEALGKSPDAVNFWYGDERSTTSLHKDHYENIYAVIAGRKIFTLIPPTEQFCLHEKQYIAATYVDTTDPVIQPSTSSTGQNQDPQDDLVAQTSSLSFSAPVSIPTSSPHYILEPLDPVTMTKWIALNPSHEPQEEIFEKYPRFQMCQPFKVELNPGEILYLPAMWYHQVEQEPDHEGKCIAVNWWYDMGFEGDRFSNATFMNNLVQLVDQI
ncbi:JmjC domain-containing protein 7 [Gryganskiella cystojenkinii]|nr:JmjC domain-containing protein 7 [Gryganskiella cystojenkinii]